MFTDMVGYTASTHADEGRTLGLLRQHAELVRPLVAVHQGREIKSTGDGFLVEFDSALKATQCAVTIQRLIHERNAEEGLAPFQIRIGIHLGDVVQTGTDIMGDTVNIAARIEPLAEPGGICLSGAVYEQVRNKIPEKLEKLPSTALKGLSGPVDIYRVVLPWTTRESPARNTTITGIAILPFTNISPDPNDEYFADGLTEELITVLSQFRELRVIARTSVTPYKATAKGVAQIGSELGVSSILEGSVRKAGNQLRITAQLIDVTTQGHVWANSYNRELNDVFAVQAELAKQVADALKIQLRATEAARLGSRPTVRPDSYLAYLKGRTLLHRDTSRTTLDAAKERFETAISLDSKNAAAYSGLADTIIRLGWWYRDVPADESEGAARRLADRALELDPNMAEAHASLGLVLWRDGPEAAEKEFRLALALSPSYSEAHNSLANLLLDENRPDEALVEFTLAEEADPLWAHNLFHMASALIWLRRLDEAFERLQKLAPLSKSEDRYHFILADYHLARSDLESYGKEIEQFILQLKDPRDKQLVRAADLAWQGEQEQARAILRQDEALPDRPTSAALIARIYAYLGDLDNCFRWVDRAYATTNLALQPWRHDPRLEAVRKDPRFLELLKKRNLA